MKRQTIYALLMPLSLCTMAAACSSGTAEYNDKGAASPGMENMIMLTPREEQYANIMVDTARVKTIAEYTTLSGTTSIDERKVTVVTARIRGRVDELLIRDPMHHVTKGQPLYGLYSEELLSYEHELLNALEQQSRTVSMKPLIDKIVEAARKKLLLYGLDSSQLQQLEKNRQPSATVIFRSPVSGLVTDLSVSEGQYVETGAPLFRIADLSVLWVEAQMYASETRWLHERPSVTVVFDEHPGEAYPATPVFESPSLEPGQKISLVRFLVNNRNLRLKPGMMTYVNVRRNEKRTLAIPKSSILLGNMASAWVKTSDGMYESRDLRLGIQNKQDAEVLSGIKEGELVVTSGAYLLNSALILKKGAGNHEMPGMKM